MKRRDFLHPRRIAYAAGQVLGALEEVRGAVPVGSRSEAPSLLRCSRQAMATTFEFVLPFGLSGAAEAGEAALDLIDLLESQLTVYRDTSEVSRLNQLAFDEAVPVEAKLFDLLDLSRRISEETAGAFDVASGALVKAWGFYQRQQRVPAPEELRLVLEQVGSQHVVLDEETRTVRFSRSGLEINLGSIGKGHALDRVACHLREAWKISSALLHGGHSSVYAMGTAPGQKRGWPVGIRHPWKPDRRLAVVWLRDRALGTSAATFQHLEYEGRKLGHILDPRTGWPAEGMDSVSVLAPTAAEADALATAFFILGVDKARAYCEAHPGIGAIMLSAREDARLILLGLDDDETDAL